MNPVTLPEQAVADHREATHRHPATGGPSRRGWAWAGLVAGAAGIAGIALSTALGAVYDPEIAGDAGAITEALGERVPLILAFHVVTMVGVVLLPVFAAGLLRRLAAGSPAASLAPLVAAGGLGLVAVAGLMGSALDTEFLFAVQEPSSVVPEAVAVYGHWIGTVPWLWVGSGLSGVAVAIAALRHGAAPRWIGWTSAVLGALTLLVGISPLQYLAGMVGPVWLVLVSAGFALGDRRA